MHIFKTLFDVGNIMMSEICFKKHQEKKSVEEKKCVKIGKGWLLNPILLNHHPSFCVYLKIQNLIKETVDFTNYL